MARRQAPEVDGQPQVVAVQGQIAGSAGGVEDEVIEAPTVGTAPIADRSRIEKRARSGGQEPASMGEHGGALVVGCGHHELGVALDLPHVDPQPRVRVEADGAAGLA